jgi:hypothetical protein
MKLRKDKPDPQFTKVSTDNLWMCEPISVKPATEQPLPKRAIERTLKLDPRFT